MATTIGVIGTGQLPARMIRAIFKDQLDADGIERLILPVSRDLFTEEVEAVADWAIANDVPIEVLTEGKAPRSAGEAVEAAVKETAVESIPVALVKALGKADPSKLFVFWDEEDADGYEAFERAWDAEISSYDLCNGLEELSFDDEDEPEPPAEREPEPEVPDEGEKTDPEAEDPRHEVDEWAELGRKTAAELKALCAEKGITVNRSGKGRIAKGAYLDALKAFEETGATEYYQEEDRVGGTKPRQGETEPRKPGKKVEEGLVTKEEAEADLADDEEPETPDDGTVPEADEDEPVELPSDDEDEDVETAATPSLALAPESSTTASTGSATVNVTYLAPATVPTVVGNCGGCGGPVFARQNGGEFPDVEWFHAGACTLK